MRILLVGVMMLSVSLIMTGCGGSTEEDVAPAESESPVDSATSTDTDEAAMGLPDGYPEGVPMLPGFVITKSEVLNADMKQYQVVGDTDRDVEQVLDFYLKAFEADGWTEDSVMSQHANIVCSFTKDGLLVFVDANTGGIGAIVDIITGVQD